MSEIIDLFKILRESGLLTAAFIIGAILLAVAIIGNFKTIIELSPSKAVALGAFGVSLMVLGFGGYFLSRQSTPTLAEASPKATPIIFVAPTNTAQPTDTPHPTLTPYPTRNTLLAPSISLPTSTPSKPSPLPIALPDLVIPGTASNGVLFTASADGNYRFTIKEGNFCWDSQCRSIIHGYLNREIVWGLWYGKVHPIEQDYELGCWEDTTKANPRCGVGILAIVPMKVQQYVRWIAMNEKGAYSALGGSVTLSVEKLQ